MPLGLPLIITAVTWGNRRTFSSPGNYCEAIPLLVSLSQISVSRWENRFSIIAHFLGWTTYGVLITLAGANQAIWFSRWEKEFSDLQRQRDFPGQAAFLWQYLSWHCCLVAPGKGGEVQVQQGGKALPLTAYCHWGFQLIFFANFVSVTSWCLCDSHPTSRRQEPTQGVFSC